MGVRLVSESAEGALPHGAGAPADFALANLNLSWKVEDSGLRSRSKNSPFEHRTLEGRVVETVVAGKCVYTYAR